MNTSLKLGARLAIVLFVLVAAAHALRLVYGTEITVDGWVVPQWVSAFGVVVPAAVAWLLWRDGRQAN